MTEVLELTDKNFKAITIILLNDIKQNTLGMNKKVGISGNKVKLHMCKICVICCRYVYQIEF